MHDDSESTARKCMECGANDDLQELLNVQIDGVRGTITSHWICRSCMTVGVKRGAAETVAFWEAQLAGPEHQREQVRAHCVAVATSLRKELAAYGVTADEQTASFIARHAASGT